MKRSSLWLAVSLTLVFISGTLVGAIGYRLYNTGTEESPPRNSRPDEFRRRYTEFMKRSLELSEDQVKQLDTILDQTRQRFEKLDKTIEPDRRAIAKKQEQEIDALLTSEQRDQLDELKQQFDERRKRSEGRSGGPPRGRRRGGPPPPPPPEQ